VKEEFPIWNLSNNQVEWQVDEVSPSPDFDHLLDNPKDAFNTFFSSLQKPKNVSDINWLNHLYASKVVVYEILCGVDTNRSLLDLLEIHFPNLEEKPQGIKLCCVQCEQDFIVSESESKWINQKGFVLPKRCRECRKYNRA
jgi:hypothetical protein